MPRPDFLAEIVALVVGSALIAYICQRLRIQPIVGFLIAGVVMGPHALGLVRDTTLIESAAEIGVVLLLFTLGIEFSLERLWRIKRTIFLAGGLQMALTIAVTAVLLRGLGVDWRTGVFSGSLVALSSTALVLKVLTDKGQLTSEKGQLSLGILIFQDLAIVALVLVVPMLGGERTSPLAIVRGLATAVGIIALLLLVARRIMPPLLERVARTCAPEIFLLSVISICLGTAWLTSLAGVSLSLGAFLAGLVVSESRFSHHAFAEILPLQILFSAVFFVSVGLLLDLTFVMSNIGVVLAVVAGILVLKVLTTGASTLMLGYSRAAAAATALLIAQIGEFSFVLERVGRAAELQPAGPAGMGGQTFIAAAVLLMLLTPLLVRGSDAIEAHVHRGPVKSAVRAAEEPQPVELQNHVVVCGYGSGARYLTRVLRDSGIPFVILTLSPTGASEAEREKLRVVLGDYSRRHMLLLAAIDRAKLAVIPDDTPDMARRVTAVARALNPTLQIIVRTQRNSDVDEMLAAGADQVLVEELEVGVQLFTRVLEEYRVSLEEIDDHVRTVRAGGYAALRSGIPEVPLVVCQDLDEACFDTRTFTVRAGARAEGRTVGDLAKTGMQIASVERGGAALQGEEVVLQAGDRITARTSAEAFAAAAELLRTGPAEESSTSMARVIALSDQQLAMPGCNHVRSVQREITTTASGCEDCLRIGDTWVQLRICMTCGGVRCCDSSKNRHATRHYQASAHPIIKTYQPAESWAWCYPDQLTL